jgi:lysophospholipase L1-like esterase
MNGDATQAAPRRRWRLRLLAVFGGLLLAVLLGELALRIVGYDRAYFNPLHSFHEPDPLVGHRGRPGFEGRFRRPEFDVRVAHDEWGFRRHEHARPHAPGDPTVLVFGDSFTWGWGVGQGEVFTDRMIRRMLGHTVLNFGLNSSGTAQQFLLFERHARDRLRPGDHVVVMFSNNDFSDNTGGLLDIRIEQRRVVCHGPRERFGLGLKDTLKDHSYLFNFAAYTLDRWKGTRRRQRALDTAPQLHAESPEIVITKHYLQAFRDACAAKRARLWVAYVPGQAEMGESPPEGGPELAAEQAFRAAFFACSESLGLKTIDLLPAMVRAREEEALGRLTYLHDEHWNARGHECVARILARALGAPNNR